MTMADDDILGTLGSIVGIGVGKMEIHLVKRDFVPGETVHGRLMLKLSRRTEAKRLLVGVEGTQESVSHRTDSQGQRFRQTDSNTVYKFEQELDGKRTYLDEGYDLHLPIQGDALGRSVEMPGGLLGDVARLVNTVVAATRSPIVWRVYAVLDIPWKVNVTAHADIAVSPR